MKDTDMESGIQLTLEALLAEPFPEQTAGASDSPVRTSAWRESSEASQANEAVFFSRLCDSLKAHGGGVDPDGFSSRMLKICLLFQQDLISQGFFASWKSWGTLSNGECLTRKILESPKTENACTLLAFMEPDSPEIQWLSPEIGERLMSR